MRELETMIRPLIAEPLHAPPSIEELWARNRRRRRRNRWRAGTGGTVVLLLAVALVVALVPTTSPKAPSAPVGRLAAYLVAAGQVPDSVLEQVRLPAALHTSRALSDQPAYTTGGKPVVLYVGAEFCPFCAVERWALAIAMAKFGAFTNVDQGVSSSSSDVYPNLKSWSFQGATYSSSTFAFQPVEAYSSTPKPTGRYTPLDSLTPKQKSAFQAYDHTGPTSGDIPFIDIGNRYVFVGAQTSPAPLEGLSLDQIGNDLSTPGSPVAQALDGAANGLLVALCAVAGSGSAPICRAPFIAQAQAAMGG